jgi:hypothetical protein
MNGTIAAWRTWATDRGDTAPTDASDELATAALVRASDYIDFTYVARFVTGCTSPNVEVATYVAASLELATPGFFTKTFTEAQQKVLTGVGSVKWTPVSRESTARSAALATPTSTLIDSMLASCMPNDIGVTPWFKSIGGQ